MDMERRTRRQIGWMLAASFLLLQAVPAEQPAAGHAAGEPIEQRLAVPQDVGKLFARACANCHSDRTAYPWYARVAPVSWMVKREVHQAREAMNLSNWSHTSGESAGREMGTLMSACASLQAGIMPPPAYRTMHPEARLSRQEIADFCAWTSTVTRQLRQEISAAR